MAKKFERIMPGVYLVGKTDRNPGVIYFRRMFNGKRIIKKSSLQGALAVDVRGRPTKALKQEAASWTASGTNKAYLERREGLKEMSFKDLFEQYPMAAKLERVKSGKPSERTVENTLKGMAKFIEAAGLKMEDSVAKLTTDLFDITITKLIQDGKTKSTAWTYAAAMQTAAARWSGPYYRHAGFKVPGFVLPAKRNMRPPRYIRPTKEQLEAVLKWYEGLWNEEDKRKWLAATMMLQFAMRNGDAKKATAEIFSQQKIKTKDGKTASIMVLKYTPQKTSNSSGRSVAWPVAPKLWQRIEEARREIEAWCAQSAEDPATRGWWRTKGDEEARKLIPFGSMTYMRLNRELREIFKDTHKASYELRKICVDHVYQSLGPEKASAISGDDLKTVSYYYADPSQAVEQEGVDITDLL